MVLDSEDQMPVVSGPAYTEVAMGLANELNMKYLSTETRRFPDGEGYLRTPVEGFKGNVYTH